MAAADCLDLHLPADRVAVEGPADLVQRRLVALVPPAVDLAALLPDPAVKRVAPVALLLDRAVALAVLAVPLLDPVVALVDPAVALAVLVVPLLAAILLPPIN